MSEKAEMSSRFDQQPALRRLRCLMPHLVLIVAYVLYLVVGGLVFSAIETPEFSRVSAAEHAKLTKAEDTKRVILELFTNVSQGTSKPEDLNLTSLLDSLVDTVDHPDWKAGRQKTLMNGRTWAFPSAMLFSLTTITTIGYGDLVPETIGGRIFCVAYSAIGVPFSFFILADIGQILAIAFINLVRWAMSKKCGSNWADRRKERESRIYGAQSKKKGTRGTHVDKLNVTMRHLQSVRYSPEGHGTSPDKNAKKGHGAGRNATPKPLRFEPSNHSMEMCEFGGNQAEGRASEISTVSDHCPFPESTSQTCHAITIIPEEGQDSTHTDEKKEPMSDEIKEVIVKSVDEKDGVSVDYDGNNNNDVPTLLIFLILISYMALSGYVYSAVENWDYGTGVYFVFITLTTIGFGDVVPNQEFTGVTCFFSLIFTVGGLAVTSMCIALAQERASRLGKRLLDFIDKRVGGSDDEEEKDIDDPEKGPQRPNQG